jgi:hypothetical protein
MSMSDLHNERRANGGPWLGACDIVAALRAGVPRACERVIAAIRAEIPAYNQPLRGEFGRTLRSGVDGAIGRFVDMIEHGEIDALGPARSLFYGLGRSEFLQGRPLDALLGAYRVGARVAWQEIVASCEQKGVEPHAVYELAGTVFAFINEMSIASTEGYGAAQTAAAEVTQAARQELVELLVLHPRTDPAPLEEASERARYYLPARVAALACRAQSPSALAARVGRAIGARLGDLACLLVPEPTGQYKERLAEVLVGMDAALGPALPAESAAQSWELARRAFELIENGAIQQRGFVYAEDHLGTIFMHCDRRLSGALVGRWLTPLNGLPTRPGEDLPETLLTWLALRDVNTVATRLHVHANTVRHRLEKLRSLYGTALEDPDASFELQLALRAAGVRIPQCIALADSPTVTPRAIR